MKLSKYIIEILSSQYQSRFQVPKYPHKIQKSSTLNNPVTIPPSNSSSLRQSLPSITHPFNFNNPSPVPQQALSTPPQLKPSTTLDPQIAPQPQTPNPSPPKPPTPRRTRQNPNHYNKKLNPAPQPQPLSPSPSTPQNHPPPATPDKTQTITTKNKTPKTRQNSGHKPYTISIKPQNPKP